MGHVTAVRERTLEILRRATGDDEAVTDLDVRLLESGLIDSLGIVNLVLAFEEAFGIAISPAELDRESWATPRALLADIERRVARVGAV